MSKMLIFSLLIGFHALAELPANHPAMLAPGPAALHGADAEEMFQLLKAKESTLKVDDYTVVTKSLATKAGSVFVCALVRDKKGKLVDFYRGAMTRCELTVGLISPAK